MTRPAYRQHPDYPPGWRRVFAELVAVKPPEDQPAFSLPQLAEPCAAQSWWAAAFERQARALPVGPFHRISVKSPVALEFVEDGMTVRDYLRQPQTHACRAYAVSLLASCINAGVISIEASQ